MSNENCVICMSTIENGDCVMLECGHIFHATCIVQWYLDTRNGCPLCRAEPTGTYRKFMTDQGRINSWSTLWLK